MTGERMLTVVELLRLAAGHLERVGVETPRLDAELLLAEVLGCSRIELYLDHDKPVVARERDRYRELIRQRASRRVPVAQLLGRREFWSLPLRVGPEVLTPRPETEVLVEAALDRVPDREAELTVLDLGTGSGAIALALARELPKARITATDVCEAALAVARANAADLGLEGRIRWRAGSWFEPVAGERHHLVVCNPPYLRRDDPDLAPELAHEPEEALFGGADGLDAYRAILAGAPEHLEPGGWLLLELAPERAAAVAGMATRAGLRSVEVLPDLAGRPRVLAAIGPESA